MQLNEAIEVELPLGSTRSVEDENDGSTDHTACDTASSDVDEDDLALSESGDSSLNSLQKAKKLTLMQKYALSVATHPKKHLSLALLASITIVAVVVS